MSKMIKVSDETHKKLKEKASRSSISMKEYLHFISMGRPYIFMGECKINSEKVAISMSEVFVNEDAPNFNDIRATIYVSFLKNSELKNTYQTLENMDICFSFEHDNRYYDLDAKNIYFDFDYGDNSSARLFVDIKDYKDHCIEHKRLTPPEMRELSRKVYENEDE